MIRLYFVPDTVQVAMWTSVGPCLGAGVHADLREAHEGDGARGGAAQEVRHGPGAYTGQLSSST